MKRGEGLLTQEVMPLPPSHATKLMIREVIAIVITFLIIIIVVIVIVVILLPIIGLCPITQ